MKLYKLASILSLILLPLVCKAEPEQPKEYKIYLGLQPGGLVDTQYRNFEKSLKGLIKFNSEYKTSFAGIGAVKEMIDSRDSQALAWSGSGATIGVAVLKKKPEYLVNDYKPVAIIGKSAYTFVTSPKSYKVTQFSELLAENCDKRIIIGAGGLLHEISGKILAAVSSCKIVVIPYPSDTSLLSDLSSGSLDMAVVAPFTAKIVESQGGKLIASTASPDDENWKSVPNLGSVVPGANLYTYTSLLSKNNIPDVEYQNLVKTIKSVWGNEEISRKYLINDGSFYSPPMFGDDCTSLLQKNIKDLTAIAKKYGIQQ